MDVKIAYRLLLLAFMALLIPFLMRGQEYDTISSASYKIMAYEAIKALKNGDILVALPSEKRKLTEIENSLQFDKLSDKERSRLIDLKEKTIEDRDEFNRGLITAMQSHFDFCNYLFTYDFHIKEILEGTDKGIFINTELEYDKSIKPMTSNRFILYKGTTNPSTTQGISAMILKNDDNTPLFGPLPYYARINKSALRCIIFGLFDRSECDIKFVKFVSKWNEDLHKFHKRVTSSQN